MKIGLDYDVKKEKKKYEKNKNKKIDSFKMFKTKSRILNKI